MKKILASYTAYNYWAAKRLAEVMNNLTEAQCKQPVTSSFATLYKTVEHSWQAESAWLQRLQKVDVKSKPTLPFDDMETLLDHVLLQSKQWVDWIENASEEDLAEELTYKNWQGDTFTTPVWQLVQHVFNHATFHRGQVVTTLRQLGVTTIPSTDFVTFTRLP